MLKAGFAEIDIAPALGTHKIGWLKEIVPTRIADPLFARAVVFETPQQKLAFLSLDTLYVRTEETAAIRKGVRAQHDFPGENVMVHATHNHAGPAVAEVGDVRVDEAYCKTLVEKCVQVVGEALGKTEDAEIAFGNHNLFDISYNRRVIQRDGTTRTHGKFDDPGALAMEGPIDPEVAVLAVRRPGGEWLGTVVNFANHPTDHGADECFSAGWPGTMHHRLRDQGSPMNVFLNGAYGNIATTDPTHGGAAKGMAETGTLLADAVNLILTGLSQQQDVFRGDLELGCRSRIVDLPYRHVTDEEIRGTVRGAQRFIDPAIYDRNIPRVLEEINRNNGKLAAEVQVFNFDDHVYASVPAEFFVQLGLRVKEHAYPKRAMIVGSANGIVGYVPTAEAFSRGGYETTFLGTSKMAPQAGDMLVDCALRTIRGQT